MFAAIWSEQTKILTETNTNEEEEKICKRTNTNLILDAFAITSCDVSNMYGTSFLLLHLFPSPSSPLCGHNKWWSLLAFDVYWFFIGFYLLSTMATMHGEHHRSPQMNMHGPNTHTHIPSHIRGLHYMNMISQGQF